METHSRWLRMVVRRGDVYLKIEPASCIELLQSTGQSSATNQHSSLSSSPPGTWLLNSAQKNLKVSDADRSAALALEEAIFGDLFQVVPRFGTWNKNAAPN